RGYGRLFAHFGSIRGGLEACAGADALVDAGAIEKLLTSFIVPLQSDDISALEGASAFRAARSVEPLPGGDALGLGALWLEQAQQGPVGSQRGAELKSSSSLASSPSRLPPSHTWARVHCSLNINTETGRLSARRPNLQNQPALEKDRYRIRDAFCASASAGQALIVADYGQLELRVLAHVADCSSMLRAFELGGDFHSRTALSMYGHVAAAVRSGECILEKGDWAGRAGPAPPLLKDVFGSERRKAKMLNFSIAYGKTQHGLSKDWGVSLEEAEETVKRWYGDRQEVLEWQERQRDQAVKLGYVSTLLGRRRSLPDAKRMGRGSGPARGHALRAAINTPIQGSAADIAAAAMLRIERDAQLREAGWRLLMQVHDEVILEGPRETAERARERVVHCMEHPFVDLDVDPLRVKLAVDANIARSWFEAK
ncbi:family A DNA polymerase, partial [Helicosporidium sp. ATCC 50920]